MKTVALDDDTYMHLIRARHHFERIEGRFLSYREVIRRLAQTVVGGKDDGSNQNPIN